MIVKKLRLIVRKNPNKVAYRVNHEQITYQELYARATALIASFDNCKNPVIILGEKSINMIVSIVACLISKRAYVPLDTFIPTDRVEKIMKDSNASLLIRAEDDISLEKLSNYSTVKYNDIAYIIFTSGSTGIPKGVPISYSNLENFISWICNIDGIRQLSDLENLNILNQASFSFDLSVTDFYYSLVNGYTLVGLDNSIRSDISKLLDYIIVNDINMMVSTPTFIRLCLLDNRFNNTKLNKLSTIYFCGEILDVSLAKKIYDRFPTINIINAYGPTEATSAVSSVLISKDMLDKKVLPIGEINQAAVEIFLDKEEIVLKGKSVFRGYLNKVSDSCYKEDNDYCYRTKDFGFIEGNYLYYKGRIDNQIKYKGYRIELEDIENNILKIEGINGCIVVPVYNNEKISYIKAYVSVDNNTIIIDSYIIKNELSHFLPSYMIPKKIEIVQELPVNKNLKFDRKKLMEDVRC